MESSFGGVRNLENFVQEVVKICCKLNIVSELDSSLSLAATPSRLLSIKSIESIYDIAILNCSENKQDEVFSPFL